MNKTEAMTPRRRALLDTSPEASTAASTVVILLLAGLLALGFAWAAVGGL